MTIFLMMIRSKISIKNEEIELTFVRYERLYVCLEQSTSQNPSWKLEVGSASARRHFLSLFLDAN